MDTAQSAPAALPASAARKSIRAYPLTISVVVFAFSMWLFPFYTGGDQINYRSFYEGLPEYGFLPGFIFYRLTLDSMEPVYYLLCYFFSGLVDKDILMSLLNAALGYYLVSWLIAKRVAFRIIALLLLNFYLLVLFFSAERLKIGVLFLLMGASFTGYLRYACLGLSLFSHVQIAVLFASRLFSRMAISCASLFRGRVSMNFVYALAGASAVAVLLFILREHIILKLQAYASRGAGGASELIKPFVFTALTIAYARHKRLEAAAMQIPILVAAFVVGGERIVLFSYFVFMMYALQYRRGANAGIYVCSGYFLVKGIIFIAEVITYGTGFTDFTFSEQIGLDQ